MTLKFDNGFNNRLDFSGKIGAVIMAFFAIYAAYRWNITGYLFFALLFLRDVMASYFLFKRNPAEKEKELGLVAILSYISAAFPFFYFGKSAPLSEVALISFNILSILGFGLASLALIDLGRSFGISPANRGRITKGVYRYINHPMYIGYAIAEFGLVVLNPQNIFIYILSMALYWLRARLEDKALNG